MTPEQKIYDVEGQVEMAVWTMFNAAGMNVNVPSNGSKFTADRPRVDALFELGQEKKSYHVFGDGSRRNASWFAQFIIEVVTAAGDSAGSSAVHRAYRSAVRSFLAPGLFALNGLGPDGATPYLPYHKLQLATEVGTTPSYPWEDDTERSKIIYNIEIGIDRAAWAELGLTAIN